MTKNELSGSKTPAFAIECITPNDKGSSFVAPFKNFLGLKRSGKKADRMEFASSEDQHWLQEQFRRHRKELIRLSAAARADSDKKERSQTHRVLMSFAGRACAVIRAAQKDKLPALPQPFNRKAFEALVNSFSLNAPLPGHARIVLVPKNNGKPRPTLKFSWEVKAAQLLVSDVLAAKRLVNPFEFNCAGKGRNRAASQMKDYIEEGYCHVVIADIKDCYSSIGPKHLEWLKLPPKVLRYSVFPNMDMPIESSENTSEFLKAARHGLPTGAMLSGKIASGLIGRVLQTLSGDIRVRSYTDDVAICARTPAAADNIACAIKSGFKQLKAGPLAFKHLEVCDIIEGFSFLNYRFRWEKDHVHVFPDQAAFKNLENNLRRLMVTLSDFTLDEKLKRAEQFGRNWRTSHALWHANKFAKSNLEAFLHQIVHEHGPISAKYHKPVLPMFP